MREGWIQLQCIDCGEQWDASLTDLPSPDTEFRCDYCDSERPVSEFVKTQRGLEILTEFHR